MVASRNKASPTSESSLLAKRRFQAFKHDTMTQLPKQPTLSQQPRQKGSRLCSNSGLAPFSQLTPQVKQAKQAPCHCRPIASMPGVRITSAHLAQTWPVFLHAPVRNSGAQIGCYKRVWGGGRAAMVSLTDTQKDRQTTHVQETHMQTHRHIHTETHRQPARQTQTDTDRHTYRCNY